MVMMRTATLIELRGLKESYGQLSAHFAEQAAERMNHKGAFFLLCSFA